MADHRLSLIAAALACDCAVVIVLQYLLTDHIFVKSSSHGTAPRVSVSQRLQREGNVSNMLSKLSILPSSYFRIF
jgi:hypothetical protein